MATMYISKITPLGSSTTYNIKDLEAIQSIATGDSNGQIKITPRSGTAYNVNVKNAVTFTKNTSVTVAGTSKDTYKYDQSAIFAPNGLIMGGTAAAAGLVTRGICGVSTPDATTGAANKDNLYINFDGTTTYSANRQLVLQAGTVGDHYGNNVYQYAAVRGDAMKAWVEAKGYITSFTDTLVKQSAKTNDANYKILLGANTNPTSGSAYEAAYDSNITINPSTHTITATTFSGNATSATGFASAKSIALTGDITGSATGGNGSNNWSIATTIGTGKVTNAMLAGSIANSKLANSKVTIAGNDVSLGGSLTADTLRTSLGLSNAMHFIGVTSTALSDGATTETLTAKTTGSLTKTTGFIAGDVVIDTNSNYEYVWTGAAWERLGPDGSYKITQTAYTDSTGTAEATTATRFVYSVSQDANGVVSFKTRPLPTYNNYSLPLAASGTRGGIQIGYSESGTNYAVKLSSEKAYVTVPWTDTKNTAGSTDTSSKIYLIGATSQADNPQTYSDSEVYVQNGTLYAVKTQDLSGTANNKPALIVGGIDTSTHMEIDANEIQAKTNGTSTAQLYINNDGGLVTVGSGGLAITSLTASQAVSTDANKKLVSTNLTVSDPTASGTGITYIATISQGATGKITATKSTVRSASTSQTGVTQYTEANTNTQLSTLTTAWTTTPTDDTLFIRRDTGGTAAFGQVKFSTLWSYIKGKITAGTYWANIKISDAATYNAAPEMATLKLNGNTSATAASTSNVTLVYDTTLQALNFVFA